MAKTHASAAALLVLGLVVPARAASIDFSAAASGLKGTSGAPQVFVLSLPQFDPSLGTLTQVSLSVDGTLRGSGRYENLDADPVVGAAVTYGAGAHLVVSSGATGRLDWSPVSVTTVALDFPPFDGALDFQGTSGFTAPLEAVSRDWPAWVFVDSNQLVDFLGHGRFELTGTNWVSRTVTSDSPLFASSLQPFVDLHATATYQYNTVPAPSSLLGFGSGLAALLAVARRRKRSGEV